MLGADRGPSTEAELDANLIAPVVVYPLFENALWGAEGTTLEEHRTRLGELWAGFARVARDNPTRGAARHRRPRRSPLRGPTTGS